MDPAILQLFAAEEIFDRIGRKQLTGSFHAFTPRESANVFFQDGIVMAAACGQLEGEKVLKQILEWKEARYVWQTDTAAPASTLKPFHIHDFLAKQHPGTETGGKTSLGSAAPSSFPSPISIPARGATTGPLEFTPDAPPAPVGGKPVASASVDLAATKHIYATEEDRLKHDEELLNKYQLTLVSREDPEQRFKLTRISSLIGRNPACDIAITHPSISRQHCLLQITDRGLHIKDLDTTNGTRVNGIVLKEGYINAGDKLTIGHVGFVVQKG